MAIERREFGKTGTRVSVLGYGAMDLRGAPHARTMSDAEASELLGGVLDAGINFVDTAPEYGFSEELIGRHISHRRDEYFLASKCGCPMEIPPDAPRPYPHTYDRALIIANVERSLTRLKTDHLDLLQVHMSPSRQQLEDDAVVETLHDLQAEGKTRFIGMSGILPHLPDHLELGVFDAFQIPYSAVQREHQALVSQAAASGAGVIIRGGLARGLLAGEGRTPLGLSADLARRRWEESGAAELTDDMDPTSFLLRFLLSNPDIHTVIVGTSRIEHLRGNVAVAEQGPLPPDVYAEALRRLDTVS